MKMFEGRAAYRLGMGAALLAAFVQVWVNLGVGVIGDSDNPQNQGFFLMAVTAAACAFAARLRPDGMARAMLATAGAQALLGVMLATAPITALDPYGVRLVILITSLCVTLWLAAAFLFRRSARPGAQRAAI